MAAAAPESRLRRWNGDEETSIEEPSWEVEDHHPEKPLARWLHTLKSMQPHVSLLQTFQITWTIWQRLPTNCRDRCEVEKDYWSTIRGTQDKYKDNRSNLELHWKLFNSIKKSLSGCLATFRPWFSLAGDCASSMSQAK
ncbi:uncharacterized protein LOC120670783 isoform X5 [Panicum virgatum]|uniref:uncharacterized protein LOC120670783 isoform X5 n=1 Tax=Panicum virgatum TaxID=38727 RepID=UPI0019D67E7F|nr:uncharacterized protein LOC120670783 isoform X5 [Panicum virgatum]